MIGINTILFNNYLDQHIDWSFYKPAFVTSNLKEMNFVIHVVKEQPLSTIISDIQLEKILNYRSINQMINQKLKLLQMKKNEVAEMIGISDFNSYQNASHKDYFQTLQLTICLKMKYEEALSFLNQCQIDILENQEYKGKILACTYLYFYQYVFLETYTSKELVQSFLQHKTHAEEYVHRFNKEQEAARK